MLYHDGAQGSWVNTTIQVHQDVPVRFLWPVVNQPKVRNRDVEILPSWDMIEIELASAAALY